MSLEYLLIYLLATARSALAAALPLWPTMPPVYNQTEIPYVTTICSTFQYYPSITSTSSSSSMVVAASPSAQDIGGATATTTEPPSLLTISVVNSHTAAISTTHNSNAGAPSPVSGSLMPGTLAAGATEAIAVPTDWAGIISVNDARYTPSDKNSLIEANYQYRSVERYAIADVDVSYV
ncbi:Osmotin- thaumatin-like protein [Apiospora hydei]|uniref:Osmotin- thaumatin-like protein n=1 Tax=Apiospora hydei TaxID=1337664 RepID=A0ABR1VBP2_9PEZI